MRTFKLGVLCMTLTMVVAAASTISAQQTDRTRVPPAPLPAQILSGKKVFISNVPGTVFMSPRTDEDDPYRPYNQFYASMKNWGYYDLLSTPAEADLIFEIRLADRSTLGNAMVQNNLRLPYFELTVRDPKSQVILWWFAERLQGANRPATGEKNYNQAMTNLVSRVKEIVGQNSAGSAKMNK